MITILQPVVPSYRVALFDRMAEHFGAEFVVYASQQDMGVLTHGQDRRTWHRALGPFRRILPGFEWQSGAAGIPVGKGDVVVVSGNPRNLAGIVLMLKARARGAHVLCWGHYWSSSSGKWRARLRLTLMQLADGFVFYTDAEKGEYLAWRGGAHAKPVFALNNGLDTRDIRRMRQPYVANEREARVLFIGRITEKADLGTLLAALAEPDCKQIGLDVIGNGELEETARQLATRLGLGDRVTWHGGTTDEARIAKIANRCQAFVYPGSVGLSLIHGLAYGLPVIVHDDRWQHMPEFAAMEPGVNGVTFSEGDATSLAGVLVKLLCEAAQLEAMSRAAVTTTEGSFNTDDMARRFCAAIQTIQTN
ncbi:MAG: glycosyltransferase [Pseudomonadota bacterium]